MFLIQFSFPNNYTFIEKDNLYNEYTEQKHAFSQRKGKEYGKDKQ